MDIHITDEINIEYLGDIIPGLLNLVDNNNIKLLKDISFANNTINHIGKIKVYNFGVILIKGCNFKINLNIENIVFYGN